MTSDGRNTAQDDIAKPWTEDFAVLRSEMSQLNKNILQMQSTLAALIKRMDGLQPVRPGKKALYSPRLSSSYLNDLEESPPPLHQFPPTPPPVPYTHQQYSNQYTPTHHHISTTFTAHDGSNSDPMAAPAVQAARAPKTESYVYDKRKDDVGQANIVAASSVADAVSTSLGPKGLDKMIFAASGKVIITNDGATILNKLEVLQPSAKMLMELSKSQDVVAEDGFNKAGSGHVLEKRNMSADVVFADGGGNDNKLVEAYLEIDGAVTRVTRNLDPKAVKEGEVSSSYSPPSQVNPPLFPSTSNIPFANTGVVQKSGIVATPVVWNPGINTSITAHASSRDPRLRYAGLDVGNLDVEQQRLVVGSNASGTDPSGGPIVHQSKVNRRIEGPNLDGLASKQQGMTDAQKVLDEMRHCTDHCELFRQESYFAYLFGVREPGFYGAIGIATGESILFIPRLPEEDVVWLRKIKPLSYFKETYLVDKVFYIDQMLEILHEQKQNSEKAVLFLLHGLKTNSESYSKPAEFEGIVKFEKDLSTLHPILTECGVLKTSMELSVIQFAKDISSEAHIEVMRNIKVGMKEYQLKSMFLHHPYVYGGCRHCSYTCICATRDDRAVLHYGHTAAPNDRTFEDRDMALLDMGAEFNFYESDITCSFPVNGKFTADQSLVYNAVLKAHNEVIRSMRPGVSWVDMHKLAEKDILELLRNRSVHVGDVDESATEEVEMKKPLSKDLPVAMTVADSSTSLALKPGVAHDEDTSQTSEENLSHEKSTSYPCMSCQKIVYSNTHGADSGLDIVPIKEEQEAIQRREELQIVCKEQATQIEQRNYRVKQYKHKIKVGQTNISFIDAPMNELVLLSNVSNNSFGIDVNQRDIAKVNCEKVREVINCKQENGSFGPREKDALLMEIESLKSKLKSYTEAGPPLSTVKLRASLRCRSIHLIKSNLGPDNSNNKELEKERQKWLEMESEWILLTDELRVDIESYRNRAEKAEMELRLEKKCSEELNEAAQRAVLGHGRMVEHHSKNTQRDLKIQLRKVQHQMKQQADRRRVEKEFQVGDWVYLRLKPYRQSTVKKRPSPKLAKRYFGPFPITERVGKVAYKLELPAGSKIHNVFHVSLLKEVQGDPQQSEVQWPKELASPDSQRTPNRIIGVRNKNVAGNTRTEILVWWKGTSESDATWENMQHFQEEFPDYDLEVEVCSDGGGNVTEAGKQSTTANELRKGARKQRQASKAREGTRLRTRSTRYPESLYHTGSKLQQHMRHARMRNLAEASRSNSVTNTGIV